MTEADQLASKLPEFEDAARRTGLYLQESAIIEKDGEAVMVARLLLGEVAFTKRIQDPDADGIDRELEQIEVHVQDEEFDDARERMARNVAAGREPLDDGDEA
jgi:hypothetical protein